MRKTVVAELDRTCPSSFEQLKESFTTVAILKHLDPNLPFVVEVAASNCGIGAVLSEHPGNPGRFILAHFSPISSLQLTWETGNFSPLKKL